MMGEIKMSSRVAIVKMAEMIQAKARESGGTTTFLADAPLSEVIASIKEIMERGDVQDLIERDKQRLRRN